MVSAEKRVGTSALDMAYDESGPPGAPPVVLLHGFPYDPRAFDEVVPIQCRRLSDRRALFAGLWRHTVPFSGQDAIGRAGRLGARPHRVARNPGPAGRRSGRFRPGARAACAVSALWPERVRGLVTCCGYQIRDIAAAATPADAEQEHRFWYQYDFHTEWGRAGLAGRRDELCRLLWKLWSPTWAFDDATFRRTAASFQNRDFVAVVIHSYRHRFGYAAGDPTYAGTEAQRAALPKIAVPTIVIHGAADGVSTPRKSEGNETYFTGRYERRLLENVGHNPPQEAPRAFAQAVLDLCQG